MIYRQARNANLERFALRPDDNDFIAANNRSNLYCNCHGGAGVDNKHPALGPRQNPNT